MEPWLQEAVDAKLLIEKNIRVRSSDGSKAVAKAVGYTCAKDSCGMLFTLNVSKQQYDRHLREAAAHRTSNFAFGTSVPARSAASSSSNGICSAGRSTQYLGQPGHRRTAGGQVA